MSELSALSLSFHREEAKALGKPACIDLSVAKDLSSDKLGGVSGQNFPFSGLGL